MKNKSINVLFITRAGMHVSQHVSNHISLQRPAYENICNIVMYLKYQVQMKIK